MNASPLARMRHTLVLIGVKLSDPAWREITVLIFHRCAPCATLSGQESSPIWHPQTNHHRLKAAAPHVHYGPGER